jgi:hypothetical protein
MTADQRLRRRLAGSGWPAGEAAGRSITWFALEGRLGEQVVRASWERGRLACDQLLLSRAGLLVDLQEVFGLRTAPGFVAATLDGSPLAVLLTLLHACDRVASLAFETPRTAS